MFDDDMDLFLDTPGGNDFEDVTGLFDVAASEMTPGEVVFADGFTLLDSMSAFEIGEPRMDTGMVLEQEHRPLFYPLSPLLPEELCWILDRSFTCEMEWHSGNTLSQTVYTLLYVHHLAEIDPDMIQYPSHGEALRTLEGLTTIVLRSAVVGLLKCCDLTWRELSKGKVHDTEDWQGEKCDISLLEGTPAEYAIQMLDEACLWLRSASLSAENKAILIDRLLLRKSLLELLRLNLPDNLHRLRPLILMARNIIRRIRSQPEIPPPVPGSRALDAFDPHITRRLHNFIPIRVVQLPSQNKTWDAIDTMLQGWDDLDDLLSSHSLFAWHVSGTIRATSCSVYLPFIRSLTQSTFQDRNMVFGVYPAAWLVDRFFSETLGITYESITDKLNTYWTGPGVLSTKELERQIIKVVQNHIRSHWLSPPRRRRYLMKSIIEWQIVHDTLRSLISQLALPDAGTRTFFNAVNATPLLWQISVAREIILSGFQQELYAADERPIAYWYTSQTLKIHLSLLDMISEIVPQDTYAHAEWQFQYDYLTALDTMSIATCAVTYKPTTYPAERMALNFRRRYKWLFTQVFPSNEEELVIPVPKFEEFVPSVTELLSNQQFSSNNSYSLARTTFLNVIAMDASTFVAPTQARDRMQGVLKLADLCEQLQNCSIGNLRWDPAAHPWFPVVAITQS